MPDTEGYPTLEDALSAYTVAADPNTSLEVTAAYAALATAAATIAHARAHGPVPTVIQFDKDVSPEMLAEIKRRWQRADLTGLTVDALAQPEGD